MKIANVEKTKVRLFNALDDVFWFAFSFEDDVIIGHEKYGDIHLFNCIRVFSYNFGNLYITIDDTDVTIWDNKHCVEVIGCSDYKTETALFMAVAMRLNKEMSI